MNFNYEVEIENIEDFIIKNDIRKIFLDWDGVITHSVKAIVDILNEENGTNINPQDIVSWNFKEADENIDDEYMEYLFTTDKFFAKLEFMEGVLSFLRNHEKDIIIVTKARTNNYIQKRLLLDVLGLGNIPIIPIPLDVSKKVINMKYMGASLFIDDSTNNLCDSNATYKIQFKEYRDDKEREWQKDWNGYVMYKWT